jgi:enamine deaminase RidA (YjgF/YER057c/UK114 family)
MVQTVETTRVYLNEQRQGVVTCVHCGVNPSRLLFTAGLVDRHPDGTLNAAGMAV